MQRRNLLLTPSNKLHCDCNIRITNFVPRCDLQAPTLNSKSINTILKIHNTYFHESLNLEDSLYLECSICAQIVNLKPSQINIGIVL
jgi:hypothetical protein